MGDSELLGRGKLINEVAQVERRGQRKEPGLGKSMWCGLGKRSFPGGGRHQTE